MTRKDRTMPLPLQIEIIRKNLLRYNSCISDPDVVPRRDGGWESWEDLLDDTSFGENLYTLERNYPYINWRAPRDERKEPRIKRDQRYWTVKINREDKVIEYSKEITIRPQKVKSKGKIYNCGRIQTTAPKKWIGRKVKISIRVPPRLALKYEIDGYFRDF